MLLSDKFRESFSNKRTRVCIYGDPGVGKTHSIAQLAKTREILYVDFDGNIEPFSNLSDDELNNIKYYPINMSATTDDCSLTSAMYYLRETSKLSVCLEHRAHDCLVCKKNKAGLDVVNILDYRDHILVIDNITPLEISAIADMRIACNLTTKDTPDLKQFGIISSRLEQILFYLTHCPLDVIVLAHARDRNENMLKPNQSKSMIPAMGSSRLTMKSMSWFSYVWAIKSKSMFISSETVGWYILNRLPLPELKTAGDALNVVFNNGVKQ